MDSPSHARSGRVAEPAYDTRRLTAEAVASLDHLLDSPLLAAGQINLISLDAIAERLGARWEARRSLTYLYTERILEHHIGDHGQFFRVSETDFLIVLPERRKFAAQMLCLRCLREVLTYFLGEARPLDVRVREVSHIGRNSLDAMLVDPAAVAVGAAREELQDVEAENANAERAEAQRSGGAVDQWTPFTASNGRAVRVSCALEPVIELKGHTRIGYRIARKVLDVETDTPLTALEMQNLGRGDVEKIDLATIARGLDRLRAETTEQRQLSLIIPVSYISIASQHGRSAVGSMLVQAKSFVRTGVICEVHDIDGVPQVALSMATALIKPSCMFLIGHLNAAPDRALGNLRNAGLHALSFEAPQGVLSDAEFLAWTKAAVRAAKLIARSVMIYRIDTPRHAALAALVGASHASLRTTG